MKIRKSDIYDCSSAAELHEKYLNESFLATLGNGFLNILYRSLADFENGIFLVAENDEKVIGFVSGTINTEEFYKFFLKRHFFRIVFVLLPKVFNVTVLRKIFETAKYSKKNFCLSVPDAEILSMAVTKDFQGKGIAKHLFENLITEFKKRGINEFKIIAGNKLVKANRFYHKMGCTKISEIEIHKGDISTVYTFRIS